MSYVRGIGYSGKEGMYIMGSSMNAALQDSGPLAKTSVSVNSCDASNVNQTRRGLALEFYRSWNRSWHNPVQYTATVPQAVPLRDGSAMRFSTDRRWTWPS